MLLRLYFYSENRRNGEVKLRRTKIDVTRGAYYVDYTTLTTGRSKTEVILQLSNIHNFPSI